MAEERSRREHRHHHTERHIEHNEISPEELTHLSEELREAIGSDEAQKKRELEGERRRRRSGRTSRRRKKKGVSIGKVLLILLLALLGVAAVAAASVFILQRMGQRKLAQPEAVPEETVSRMAEAADPETGTAYEEGLIRYKGEKYRYNEDIVTILFMGIDRSVQEQDNQNVVIGESGQADTLILGVVDNKNGKITLINISRDTIAPVARYNTDGEYVDLMDMQICLAYAFGDGQEKSCENVVRAVSDYFYGIPISAYAAIDYEGIGVLTEVVGGVDVTITDNFFAERYPEMTAGNTVKLSGRDAIMYVRARDSYSFTANSERMQRQKQFLLGLIRQTLAATRRNLSIPLALYNSVSGYMLTDLGAGEITYLASQAVKYGFEEDNMRSVAGEIVDLDGRAAFYADEVKFYEMVLEVFYNRE